MFAASQQMNNPDGLEFTGDTVRAAATRVANANFEKEKKQRRTQSCGGLLKPRRPAGAQAAVAAAAATSPLYKRAFASSRSSARVEGRQLLMGSRVYSWSTINHRDPGLFKNYESTSRC